MCDLQSALRGRMSYFKATRPHLTDNFHPSTTLADQFCINDDGHLEHFHRGARDGGVGCCADELALSHSLRSLVTRSGGRCARSTFRDSSVRAIAKVSGRWRNALRPIATAACIISFRMAFGMPVLLRRNGRSGRQERLAVTDNGGSSSGRRAHLLECRQQPRTPR